MIGANYLGEPYLADGYAGITSTPGTGAASASLTGVAAGVVFVPGTGSSTATLTGAAAGAVEVDGTGSSTATLTGAAAGVTAVSGTGASTASLTGIAAATVSGVALAFGDATLTGAAAGAVGLDVPVSSTASLSGLAVGTIDVPIGGATAEGNAALTGIAVGEQSIFATGTGTLAVSGLAIPAEVPPAIPGLCIFLTPQVRDRPPYLPDSSRREIMLMRHFENRLRGVLVWERNDGTYCVDTTCNYESAQTQPAAFISDDPIGPDWVPPNGSTDFQGLNDSNVNYPWNPKPGSTNSTIPGSFAYNVNWDQTTQDFILNPYLIQWWEGGAYNVITQAQALALTMAGFGDCIAPAPVGADIGSEPQGLGPYGSAAINQ